YEDHNDAIRTAWSERCHCCACSLHRAVKWICSSGKELGVHYVGYDSWVLAEGKSVMMFYLFCGSGGLLIGLFVVFHASLGPTDHLASTIGLAGQGDQLGRSRERSERG